MARVLYSMWICTVLSPALPSAMSKSMVHLTLDNIPSGDKSHYYFKKYKIPLCNLIN